MAPVDFLIIGAYLIGITLFGLYVGRRDQSSDSFFLASRRSTWPVVGLALLASNISSTTLVGLAGAAYSVGISAYNYEWMGTVVLVLFCVFFILRDFENCPVDPSRIPALKFRECGSRSRLRGTNQQSLSLAISILWSLAKN